MAPFYGWGSTASRLEPLRGGSLLFTTFYNLLGGSFNNRGNVRAPIQFRKKVNTSILKDDFSSRIRPYIFTSTAPVLLGWSNKTSWAFPALKSTSNFLPQSTVSCRSVPSSQANSSCCHRSDAWSTLIKEHQH